MKSHPHFPFFVFVNIHPRRRGTYRTIELPFVVHPQVKPAVHSFYAYQSHSEAYEFQNTCRRITQLFCA